MGYDYEQIAKCQYPVFSPGTPTLEDDCGEPALFHVWWWDEEYADYDLGDMNVCQEHFDVIREQEKLVNIRGRMK